MKLAIISTIIGFLAISPIIPTESPPFVPTTAPEPTEALETVKPVKHTTQSTKAPVEPPEPPKPKPQPITTLSGMDQCKVWMAEAGVPITDAALILIQKESGCNPNAVNPSSGACGIGQQLPCGKWPHQWNDPVGGLKDMYNYVLARYGSWESALNFHYANNWY